MPFCVRISHKKCFRHALRRTTLAELESLECDHQKEAIWKEEDFAAG